MTMVCHGDITQLLAVVFDPYVIASHCVIGVQLTSRGNEGSFAGQHVSVTKLRKQ